MISVSRLELCESDSSAYWPLTVIDSPVVIPPETAQLSVPLPPVITETFSDCDSHLTADRNDQASTLHINTHSPLAFIKT